MATQAQIDANRRNAKSSTGPRTDDGKATVARNAVIHGFYCQHLILPGEDETELQALRQSIFARLQPIDEVEKLYAERFTVAAWKLKRLIAADQQCLDYLRVRNASELTYKWSEKTDRNSKHAATLERAMDKALGELMKLQKNRPERAPESAPLETASPQINENKPNSDPDTNGGPPASAGGVPENDQSSASMKIEIVKTNPIPTASSSARVTEELKSEETNPIPEQPHDSNA